MGGVQTYALLCESVLGRAADRGPAAVPAPAHRHLRRSPTEQTIRGQRRRALAVWTAIERACSAEDFRPHVGPLCDYCAFKSSCPAFAA